jgi:hypothetical protein
MRQLASLLVVLLCLTGCSGKPENPTLPAPGEAPADAAAPPPPGEAEPAAATPGVPPGATASRQLVYNAALTLKVPQLPRAIARVDSLVRGSSGWTQAATQTRADTEWRQEMTIRVRPEKLTDLLAHLATLGTVESKSLTTEDVTAAHADVAARLRTRQALEQRYLELLRQTRKVSDILEIEAKLGAVREEIEAAASRLKALNEQVAYSTITLQLYQTVAQPTPEAPELSFSSRLLEALYGGWELTASLAVGFLYLWPVWLLLGAGVGGRRRRQ